MRATRIRLTSYILEILKGNHNRRDVIEGTLEGRVLEHTVHRLPTLLMQATRVRLLLDVFERGSIPCTS